MNRIVIGTRGSELALWQAEHVRQTLSAETDTPIEITVVKTTGDEIDALPFSKMQGKGFFTKELEEELLAGRIDLAVHSMKDLQTTLPDGLSVGAVCSRADPREIALIDPKSYDESQPLGVKEGKVIGTSAVRRQCQISELMPSLKIRDLRGNVPTRVRKLRDGRYDAIIIAYAGIIRLGIDLSDLQTVILDLDTFLPAPAQGIVAVEIREKDDNVGAIVSSIDNPDIRVQVGLERGLLAKFEGGCRLPLGAISMIDGESYSLKAILGIGTGESWDQVRRVEVTGSDPDLIVSEAFRRLTERP
jgi:hydroxymethylbilane synthase